jgi:hypothetical protein
MYGHSLDHGELIGGGHFEPSGWEPRPRIPFSAGACATRIMLLVRTSSIPEQMLRILRLAFRRAMIVANVALRLRSPFGIARTPLNMSRDTHAKANLSAVFVRQLNLPARQCGLTSHELLDVGVASLVQSRASRPSCSSCASTMTRSGRAVALASC